MRPIKFKSIGEPRMEQVMELDSRVWRQFTGLKDKNGKEIYEGDIVKINKDKWAGLIEIKWNENKCGWPIRLRPHKDVIDREIVGNIYEHPTLLDNK